MKATNCIFTALTALLLFVASSEAFAQSQGRAVIDGYVTESDSTATVDFATVKLLSLPDSALLQGVVTKDGGRFSMTAKAGNYLLRVSSVGYSAVSRNITVSPSDTAVHLGRISFMPGVNELAGVEIVVQVPPVVQKGDTTTYNASAFKVAEGSALEDLLKKLPGAALDEEGNLLINGQKVDKVMMDGEEYMMGDLNSAMKDIPAEMVDKLKVYHRKSEQARATGVDDGNEEYVLDLRVKPDMKQGWNGELMAGIRNDSQYQGKASVRRFTKDRNFSVNGNVDDDGITSSKRLRMDYSQRSDKLRLGVSAGLNKTDRDTWSRTEREYFLTDTTSEFSSSSNTSASGSKGANVSANIEWRPDSLTTLTFRPQVALSKDNTSRNDFGESNDTNHKPINTKEAVRPEESDRLSTRGELYVNRRLGKPGRNISLNLTYSIDRTDRSSTYDSRTVYHNYGDSLALQRQRISTDDDRNNFAARLSYTEPLFKDNYLKADYQYTNKPSGYSRSAYEWNDSIGDYGVLPDSADSRYTKSRYNIHNGSISFVGNMKEKLSYTLGIRVEAQQYANLTYFEQSTIDLQARTVVNYAPNFNMTLKMSKQSTFRMGYSGYSSQPSLNDLQAVTDNTDPLNIKTGNPNLRPSFTNRLNGRFSQYFKTAGSNINASVEYSNTTNKVAWIVDYNPETGVRKNSPRNVSGDWSAGGSFSFFTPVGKKRKFNVETNSNVRYRNRIGFATTDRQSGSVETYTRYLYLAERLRGSFRSKWCSFDASAEVNYSNTTYSMRPEANNSTFDYILNANADVTLPLDIQLSSDIRCRLRHGYSGGNNRTRTMFNIQLSRAFLKRKSLVVRLNIYDIFEDREEYGRSVSETSISDWSRSSSEKTFMLSLTYKFNKYGINRRR